MKKIMLLLSGLAFAVGAFADAVTFIPTAKTFDAGEQNVDGVGSYDWTLAEEYYVQALEDTVQANFWLYGATGNSPATVTAFGDEVQYVYADDTYDNGGRFDEFEATDNNNYLKIETAASTPLFRTLADCSSSTQKVAIGSNGIMIDTLVKFTGAEEEPTPGAEDKLIVWLKGLDSDDTVNPAVVGETNLYVTAGVVGDESTAAINLPISGYADGTSLQVVPDRWYRLTVKAMANIFDGQSELVVPGFLVYLDGKLVKYDESEYDITDNLTAASFNDLAQMHFENGTLFPSLVRGDATLSAVGFEGTGGIDDLRIADGTAAPAYAQEFSISYDYGEWMQYAGTGWNYVDGYTPSAFYSAVDGTVYLPTSANFVSGKAYTFVGWYDNAGLTGDAITSFNASTGGAKIFYAKFEAAQNDFTYEPPTIANATVAVTTNGAPAVADNGQYTIPAGATVVVTYTAAKGYGFYNGSTGTYEAFNGAASSAGDITVDTSVEPSAKSYTIAYFDGDTGLGLPIQSMPVGTAFSYAVTNADFELSAPLATAKPGYNFVSWTNNLGQVVTTNVCADAENKAYYATWNLATYTVSYLESDGVTPVTFASEVKSSYTVEDADFELPTPATKNGYEFVGWTNGVGTAVTTNYTADAENKTYYAKWLALSYSINYEYDDRDAGTNITAAVGNLNQNIYNTEIGYTFETNLVTLAGYTCVGFKIDGVAVEAIAPGDYGVKDVTVVMVKDAEPDPDYKPLEPGEEAVVDTMQEFIDATNEVGGVVAAPKTGPVAAAIAGKEAAYQALFTYYATKNESTGKIDVTVDFTEAAKTTLAAEADTKVASLPVADLAAGTAGSTQLEGLTPGLYYSVVYCAELGGTTREGTPALAGSDGTATLTYPTKFDEATAGFYKIKVSATAE